MNMKKIKLSPFWLAILVALAVLVFGLAPLVGTKMNTQAKLKSELKRKDGELKAAAAGTPSRMDIDSWAKYKAELIRSYGDITKFYTDSDKFLERWFPNMLLGADGDPARDTFMARYLDEGRQLALKLGAEPYKVGIGVEDDSGKPPKFGFNWEAVTPADWTLVATDGPGEEKTVLRELQKRYWARHRLANVVLTSNVKISRIVDFRFFKRLHPKLGNAPWETYPSKPEEVIHWQGVGADATSGQPRGFVETDLPSDLGKTLTFGFAVELPYSEVTKVIREILNPGNEAVTQERMLVNLIGTHITIRDQNEPLVTYQFELGNEADKAAKLAAALARAGGDKARPVLLAVTCQIIDFDPTKVKKFDAKTAQ
jgi:hypothetical protein